VIIIVEVFFLLLFLLLITVIFVEKVNTDRGALRRLPGIRPIVRFNPLSVCLNKHQIEIRVLRLISKVLIVFKHVNPDLLTIKNKGMEFTYFIGTDVSKNELDFAVMQGKTLLFHKEVVNNPQDISAFLKELSKLPGFTLNNSVFCMEHTGIYNNHLLGCLYKKKANICLEAATQIKNSLGNIRGKSDKIDAIRIAEYAYRIREELHLWQPKRDVIEQLAYFSATRSRLIEAQKSLKTPLKETGAFINKKLAKQNDKLCSKTLTAIETDLEKVDKAIDAVIAADQELKRLFSLITSVSGIGKVTATMIIISTNEFKDINDPKKFACHAGVAPFTKESGLFKGKARVSHMANKKLKTLLHLAALVSIQYNEELRLYYQRKVLQEKKNKMSTINAVRNKLILRVFACVNQDRLYEKNYHKLLA
jgi:transposase